MTRSNKQLAEEIDHLFRLYGLHVGTRGTHASSISQPSHTGTGWTKVAAGNLGAVSSLTLSNITGHLRYRLVLHARGDGSQTPLYVTANGDTSNAYYAQIVNIANAVVTGVSIAPSTSIPLIPSSGAAGIDNSITLDLLVMHDDQASSNIMFSWQGHSVTTAAGSSVGRNGGGQLDVSYARITSIELTFTAAIVTGSYVLYGSNEVA